MRILFLASRLPYPPDRGDRVRAFHLLAAMSEDHEVDLVSFAERAPSKDEKDSLHRYCRRVEVVVLPRSASVLRAATGLFTTGPLQVHYYRDRKFRSLVRTMSIAGNYDLVFSHLFRVYPYARLADGAYRLLDLTDVVSREVAESARYRGVPMRWVYRLESARIRRFEEAACRDADETWVISETEKELLGRSVVTRKVHVIPNGLCAGLAASSSSEPEPGRLGFLGHLEVFHNVDGLAYFIKTVLPVIRATIPEARLVIGGVGGSPVVEKLARRPGVSLEGYVPDLAGFLRRCSVFVAPLRLAAGTQNKVIQAMAAGVPVLMSPQVASGIEATPGKEVVVASSDEDWAQEAIRLLRDPAQARAIGAAGRRFALSAYDWGIARTRLREIEKERRAGGGGELIAS